MIVGIDVSKDHLDVYSSLGKYMQVTNDSKGFKEIMQSLGENSHYVLEATASYYLGVSMYMFNAGAKISVVNPLVVKRFVQMRLRQTKTDKADAEMICLYAQKEDPPAWVPASKYIRDAQQLVIVSRGYFKERTSLKNRLHALESTTQCYPSAKRSLKRQIKSLNKEIKLLEQEADGLIKEHQEDLLTRLKSIPGIGTKTAIMLILSTDSFKRFETGKQLSSFVGLAPIIIESGTSIKGKGRISKTGSASLRNLLFMCSLSAVHRNKSCKAMYDRMINKGKPKKVALIAVANKLLKQSLAIAKSGLSYDEDYRSVLCRN